MKEAKVKSGMGLWVLLFLLMLTLKFTVATGVSWFWVFFPLIFPVSLFFLAMFMFVFAACATLVAAVIMVGIDNISEK